MKMDGNRKNGLMLLITFVILVGALVVSCTTAPAPKISPAPSSPATAPKAESSTVPAASNPATTPVPHPVVQTQLYSSQFGTQAYIGSFAWAEMINKYSTWLKASAVETTGPADAMKTIYKNPSLRKTASFILAGTLHNDTVTGMASFKDIGPVRYQVLTSFSNRGTTGLMTLNPKIQKIQDLKGKRVSNGGAGAVATGYEALLRAHGITDFTPQYLGWDDSKDALIDGRIDASVQSLAVDLTPNEWQPSPVVEQLLPMKGLQFISYQEDKFTTEVVKNYLITPGVMPAGILKGSGGKLPPQPLIIARSGTYFAAYPEFDVEIAYEMVRIFGEHAKEFETYHKSLVITQDRMGMVPVPPLEFHPAALRYLKERGIKVGQ